MTIEINNLFISAGSVFGFVVNFFSSSIAYFVFSFIANSASAYVNNSISGFTIIFLFTIIVGRIVFAIIKSQTTFFNSKKVIIKDYTNFKLYIKETIWIRRILFNKTINVENYMLDIPDKIC